MTTLTGKQSADPLALTENDLRAFVGPNADSYADYLEKSQLRGRLLTKFVWTAVLLPLVWLAYRRFYFGVGIFIGVAVAIAIAQDFVPLLARFGHHLGLAMAFAVAASGGSLVVMRAAKQAAKADAAGLAGAARQNFLAERGGVSWISAGLAGIFMIGAFGWIAYLAWGAAP